MIAWHRTRWASCLCDNTAPGEIVSSDRSGARFKLKVQHHSTWWDWLTCRAVLPQRSCALVSAFPSSTSSLTCRRHCCLTCCLGRSAQFLTLCTGSSPIRRTSCEAAHRCKVAVGCCNVQRRTLVVCGDTSGFGEVMPWLCAEHRWARLPLRAVQAQGCRSAPASWPHTRHQSQRLLPFSLCSQSKALASAPDLSSRRSSGRSPSNTAVHSCDASATPSPPSLHRYDSSADGHVHCPALGTLRPVRASRSRWWCCAVGAAADAGTACCRNRPFGRLAACVDAREPEPTLRPCA